MMRIADREIGQHRPPFVIAEISGNHGGVYENALKLCVLAHGAGADAVKLQAYDPDSITLDSRRDDFLIKDGPWKGQFLIDLYQDARTPLEWIPKLFAACREIGILAFASVFDEDAIKTVVDAGACAIKIASFEIVDTPLIEAAAKTELPLIISTGMATPIEIIDAYEAAAEADVAFLHCISGYPTEPEEANLTRIEFIEQLTHCCVGISDHSLGPEIPIAATAVGACIIEKHIKIPGLETADSKFSLTPAQFSEMTGAVYRTWRAMKITKARSEDTSRPFRRSLYAVTDIPRGSPLTHDNIRSIRPGYGLPPKELPNVLGRLALRNITRGEALRFDMIG